MRYLCALCLLCGIVSGSALAQTADGAKPEWVWLEVSNDMKTLFFDKIQLIQFMTGRLLGHPGDPTKLTHRLVLGVLESLGNEVIVQFDMPDDSSEMVHTCGLEWGRRK